MATEAQKIQEEALRNALSQELANCSKPQISLFHRIYGTTIPTNKLEEVYDLVQRTLRNASND